MSPDDEYETRDLVDALATTAGGRKEVAAVWLYGSTARGRSTPLSDVDVAVLFTEEASESAREDASRVVARAAAAASKGRDVDVRDLDALPLAVQGRVLTEGRLAVSRDEVRRVRFEVRVRQRYFDFLPFQRQNTEEGLSALRKMYLGG